MAPLKDTSNPQEFKRALFAEFLSMTLFVFLGCGAVLSTGQSLNTDIDAGTVNNTSRIMPVAMNFGIGAVVLLYCTHGISGGHMNPAVTVFMMLIKQITPTRGAGYIVAQFLGGIVGAFLLYLCTTRTGINAYDLGANHLHPKMNGAQGLLLETMGTMMLCLTIFFTEVMTGGPTDGKPNLSLLVIGLSIFCIHVFLIPFTGCGINPARTFGPDLIGVSVDEVTSEDVYFNEDCWIYYLGPLLGAIIASGFHFILYQEPETTLKDNERLDEL